MGKFFVNDCNFTMEDNFLDELRNLTWEYPEIFTGIEVTTSENVVCSIAVFVTYEDVLVVDVCIDDDNEEEFAFITPWFFDNERWYEFNPTVVADNATAAAQAVISHANTYLGYAFVSDKSVHNSGAAPGASCGVRLASRSARFLRLLRRTTVRAWLLWPPPSRWYPPVRATAT